MKPNFTPKTLKIVPVEYLDGVIQPSICDEHDEQICLVEIGKEKYAPYLAAAPEMYEDLNETISFLCDFLEFYKKTKKDPVTIEGMTQKIKKYKNTLKKARGEK